MKWTDWAILVLGVWLIVAPFALAYTETAAATYEDVILGVLIAVLALWRGVRPRTPAMTGVSWVLAVAGLWVVIAPFVIGYTDTATAVWNDVIVGLAVAILGIPYRAGSGRMRERMATPH